MVVVQVALNLGVRYMNNFRKLALIGIATAGIATIALPVFAKQGECHAQHRDSAKFEAMMQKRQTELHAKLKLSTEQESAWKAFTQNMTPSGGWGKQDRAQLSSLHAPERMEKMLAQMKQREASMGERLGAVKTFYAVLTPEQQKVFDDQFAHHGRH